MPSETLLVMTMAFVPMLLATGLWWSVTGQDDDALHECLASAAARPDS